MKIRSVVIPRFEKRGGLVTAIAQDRKSREILMVAFTDRAGFLETLETGEAVYYSTSRKQRWKKGETSGNIQIVHEIKIDCDADALIYVVDQKGKGACHVGKYTCFYRSVIGSVLQMNEGEKIETLPVHQRIDPYQLGVPQSERLFLFVYFNII